MQSYSLLEISILLLIPLIHIRDLLHILLSLLLQLSDGLIETGKLCCQPTHILGLLFQELLLLIDYCLQVLCRLLRLFLWSLSLLILSTKGTGRIAVDLTLLIIIFLALLLSDHLRLLQLLLLLNLCNLFILFAALLTLSLLKCLLRSNLLLLL